MPWTVDSRRRSAMSPWWPVVQSPQPACRRRTRGPASGQYADKTHDRPGLDQLRVRRGDGVGAQVVLVDVHQPGRDSASSSESMTDVYLMLHGSSTRNRPTYRTVHICTANPSWWAIVCRSAITSRSTASRKKNRSSSGAASAPQQTARRTAACSSVRNSTGTRHPAPAPGTGTGGRLVPFARVRGVVLPYRVGAAMLPVWDERAPDRGILQRMNHRVDIHLRL